MQPLSKAQLKIEMKRFIQDRDRGISLDCFGDICGLCANTLQKVFISGERPLTEYVQIRVNRAYAEWKNGNLRTMRTNSGRLFGDYRKEAIPPLVKHTGIVYTPDGFKLKMGLKNRHDYSTPTIDEALKG